MGALFRGESGFCGPSQIHGFNIERGNSETTERDFVLE